MSAIAVVGWGRFSSIQFINLMFVLIAEDHHERV